MIKNTMKLGRIYPEKTTRLVVPVLFWATGIVSIIAGLFRVWAVRSLLFRGDVGRGSVISTIHLFTLGGLTMLMMGALYQLGPVLLNCDPVATRYSFSQWAIYLIGIAFFVFGLNYNWTLGLALGGIGVSAGIVFFLINMVGRIRRRNTWNGPALFFATALAYLALTLGLGLLLLLRYTTGGPSLAHELSVHLTVALGGWFGFLVTGVSYRLWAMFGRRHHQPQYWIWTWALGNTAIVLLVTGYVSGVLWLTDGGWVCQLVAFGFYGTDIVAAGMLDRRTMTDPALRTLVPSLASLALWELLGSWAMLGRHELWVPALFVYGLGWVGMSFLGFVQKILPFMVWLHRYAHVHGQGKMPRLEDIWHPSWGYGPIVGTILGLALMLIGYGTVSGPVFTVGVGLQILAWMLLIATGARALWGPHRPLR